jgi:hypothetical protein
MTPALVVLGALVPIAWACSAEPSLASGSLPLSGTQQQITSRAVFDVKSALENALFRNPEGIRGWGNSHPAWMTLAAPAEATTATVYVSALRGTTVNAYRFPENNNAPPFCAISVGFVQGIGVDQSGNLWVPDGSTGITTEYGPNCGNAKLALKQPAGGGLPDSVAFDGSGHVYVGNETGPRGGPGDILQYTGSVITKTLTANDIGEIVGIAVDNRDNVWASYRSLACLAICNSGYVAEFVHGNMPAKLFQNISLALPGSIQFDAQHNLLAVDAIDPRFEYYPGLQIYAPPYTGRKPTAQILLHDETFNACTLNHGQSELICANAFGSVDIYSYPRGKYIYSFTNGLFSSTIPDGIAIDPAPYKS